MLSQRLVTAAIGIPAILLLILAGGIVYIIAVAAVLTAAILEFFAATDPAGNPAAGPRPHIRTGAPPFYRQRLPAMAGAAAAIPLVLGAGGGLDQLAGILFVVVAFLFLLLILTSSGPEDGLRDWTWVLAGLVYVGFLGSHLVLLRDLHDGRGWAIVTVFGTFATDTFAYFVGRSMGRIHIAPVMSPGKTLEGFGAALIGGLLSVAVLVWITDVNINAGQALLLGLLLPLAAMTGDLAESFVKRGAGVKDTSGLVPGHGGILDRLDSILFTAPLVYYFVIWVVL